jgi:hypothetical protein
MARRVPFVPGCLALLTAALSACGGAPQAGARSAPGDDPSPALVATGTCLGRVCLGMGEAEAIEALGAPAGGDPDAPRCYRTAAGIFLSFWVDVEDPAHRVIGMLATTDPHCSVPVAIGDPGAIATCRGVRIGDPASFVAKMHRQAQMEKVPGNPWPEAPDGTIQMNDQCEAGDKTPRTALYLRGGLVVGLAITYTGC